MKKTSKFISLVLILCLLFQQVTYAIGTNSLEVKDPQKKTDSLQDVKGHWAESSIEKFLSKGWIKGYPGGLFRPDSFISRSEFTVIAARLLRKINPEAGCNYSDVRQSDWYYHEIAAMSSEGYIKGYEDNTFKPAKEISRQEMAVFSCNLLKIKPLSSKPLGVFKDESLFPEWSAGSISALAANKMVSGYPDGTFKPEKNITRAEAVKMLDLIEIVEQSKPTKVPGAVITALPTVPTATPTNTPVSTTSNSSSSQQHTNTQIPTPTENSKLPPNPAKIAPPLKGNETTSVVEGSKFIWSGENPIQKGVKDGTIEKTKAAVLRGKVCSMDNKPLPEITVSILNHPEYGTTLTRADGMYDMAVNGGEVLTVNFSNDQYIPVQRQIDTHVQRYTWVNEIVMMKFDKKVTSIDLSSTNEKIQVAQGSPVKDNDGTRQSTLLFGQGTTAEITLPDGTKKKLDKISIRSTEFSVGENGQKAMPAILPPTSGYTYCVEYTLDEALEVNAKNVEFNKPIINYIDNFLDFPVGEIVPSGYYDREKGLWVPSDNGIILKILSVKDGLAELDIKGTGIAASSDELAKIGITDDERKTIAGLYQVGKSYWRVPITHFTPWDYNWPYGPPADAATPNNPIPEPDEECDPDTECGNSFIDVHNMTLGEMSGINGTPFSLYYKSNRTSGFKNNDTVEIPLIGDKVPLSLQGIKIDLDIAGKHYSETLKPSANLKYIFNWDRKDGYGREIKTREKLDVKIEYLYPLIRYSASSDFTRAFANVGSQPMVGISDRQNLQMGYVQKYEIPMGDLSVEEYGLGGWSLDVCHSYNPTEGILYMGDGSQVSPKFVGNIITTVKNPRDPFYVNSVFDQYGNMYGIENNKVVKLTPNGTKTVIAGTGSSGYGGDGGPAVNALLNGPEEVALDKDGNLYIADHQNNRVRKVTPDGIISTIAGNGTSGYNGDNIPATSACVRPHGIAFDKEGNLLIADCATYRLRKVNASGIISTVAGSSIGFSGDGGPAINAKFAFFTDVEVDSKGNIFIADTDNNRIRKIDTNGIITTVAGNGKASDSGDGGYALQAGVASPDKIYIDTDGNILFARYNGYDKENVRKVMQAEVSRYTGNPINIASTDGTQIFGFTENGKHMTTIDSITGKTIYKFVYDSKGLLTSVQDKYGKTTSFERDQNGILLGIVGPYNHKTVITTDKNGYLASLKDPAGGIRKFYYSDNGLMIKSEDARGYKTEFAYDSKGRLVKDSHQTGEFIELSKTVDADNQGYTVKTKTAMGREREYKVEKLGNGDKRMTETCLSSGLKTTLLISADGTRTTTTSDGTIVRQIDVPDPIWGMDAPITAKTVVTLPGGSTYEVNVSKTVELSDPSNKMSVKNIAETNTVNGREYKTLYDVNKRQVTSISPMGKKVVTSFDEVGNIIKVEAPGQLPLEFTYDMFGRLVSTKQGVRETKVTFDASGNISNVSGPSSNTVNYKYDQAGRMTEQTYADNNKLQKSYDAAGNPISIISPEGQEYLFSYSPTNQISGYQLPANGTEPSGTAYEYNLDKQLIKEVHPDGIVMEYSYFGCGRIKTVKTPDGVVEFSRNASIGGKVSDVSFNGVKVAYTYDGGFTTSEKTEAEGINSNVAFEYDKNKWIKKMTVNNHSVEYRYDDDGYVTQAGDLTMSYNSSNGNLENTVLDKIATVQSYNDYNELSYYTMKFDGNDFLGITYEYDELGRIKKKTESAAGSVYGSTKVIEYEYKLTGELSSVSENGVITAKYQYDANGNRLKLIKNDKTVDAAYDSRDRLIRYGSNIFKYNPNGELQSKINGADTTTYDYDALGNLTEVKLPDGRTLNYIADGNKRRIGKKINGTIVQAFVYKDYLNPVAELDGSGNVISCFVYGASSDIPDYMVKGGITYRIFTDHLGSVRTVMNASTGEIVQKLDYDEFGNVILDTNPGFQPFGYASGLYDLDTRLVRFGARDYDAETGRWLSKDPIMFEGNDSNLYAYCNSDSINSADPTGFHKGDKTYGLPKDFWNWYHRQVKRPGDPDLTKEEANDLYDEWKENGKPNAEGKKSPNKKGKKCSEDEEESGEEAGDEAKREMAETAVKVGGTALGLYLLYRGVRMLPSLFPPLWPTIPANLAIP